LEDNQGNDKYFSVSGSLIQIPHWKIIKVKALSDAAQTTAEFKFLIGR